MTTGKTIALTRQTFVGQVMSLLFNMLSRLVIDSLSRSKCLLISWLQSLSAVISEPKKIKSVTVFIVSPCVCHEVMGPDAIGIIEIFQTGEDNGTPLQYSSLENPTDRGAWWAIVHGVTNSRTQLSARTHTCFHKCYLIYFPKQSCSIHRGLRPTRKPREVM